MVPLSGGTIDRDKERKRSNKQNSNGSRFLARPSTHPNGCYALFPRIALRLADPPDGSRPHPLCVDGPGGRFFPSRLVGGLAEVDICRFPTTSPEVLEEAVGGS